MDEVILPIRMRIGDMIIIWQLAQRDKRTVENWIMNCVVEKIQRLQQESVTNQETIKTPPAKKERRGGGE